MSPANDGKNPYSFLEYGSARRLAYQEANADPAAEHAAPPSRPIGELTLENVITGDKLIDVFYFMRRKCGAAPGIDQLTYDDFGRVEITEVLRNAANKVRSQQYLPLSTRRVEILKANGKIRELRLGTIVDRVIARTVYEAIVHGIDRHFLPMSYGFRPGMGPWYMLAAIAAAIERHGYYFVAVDDIRDAFPNVQIAPTMEGFGRHVRDAKLLALIDTILRGAEGASRVVDIDQGNPLSPLALNVKLHYCFDLAMLGQTIPLPNQPPTAADRGAPLWHRYADNLVAVCQSTSDGRNTIERAQTLLTSAGFSLKGEDGGVINLRRQGAHADILGFRMVLKDDQVRFTVGDKAWRGLREGLVMAHSSPRPSSAARLVIKGWLGQIGPSIESVELEDIFRRVWVISSEIGFVELDEGEMKTSIENAKVLWKRIQESVKPGGNLSGGPIPTYPSPPS